MTRHAMYRDVSVQKNFTRRMLGSVGITFALLGPLLLALVAQAPEWANRPLSSDRTTAAAHPVELFSIPDDGQRVQRVPLWRIGSGSLATADRLDLLVATWTTRPTVEQAVLHIGTCEFRLTEALTVSDGESLPLQRMGPCADDASATAELTLTVRGPGRLAWWTWSMPADASPEHAGLTLTTPDYQGPIRSIGRGRIVEERPGHGVTRAALLSWLHRDEGGTLVLWWIAALGAAVALSVLLVTSGRTGLVALGVGGLAAAVALTWAIVMPPLQGADEPDHLLSAAEVTGNKALTDGLPSLAQRVHFERIRWHTYERFTPVDRETPFPIAWTRDINSERMYSRSPLTASLWTLTAQPSAGDPGGTLLRMRVINALVFAAAVALAVFLVSRGPDRRPAWLMVGVALMPTFPYIGTMVSDWAFLASWTVLLGGGLIMLIHGRATVPLAGLVIGVAAALLLGTGMAAFTMLPIVAAAVVGYLVVGGDTRRPLFFWGGIAIGGALAGWLLADLATVGFERYDAASRSTFQTLLQTTNTVMAWVVREPWVLLVVPMCGMFVDVAAHRIRSRERVRRAGRGVVRTIAAIVVLVAGAQLLLSLITTFPTLTTMPVGSLTTSPWTYIEAAAPVLATAARLRDFDLLTFSSLWGGFGWLDAVLPSTFLWPIVVVLSLCWVAVWRVASGRATALTLMVCGGGMAGTALTIAATAMMGRNLHGRYLLPVVVPVVMAVAASAGWWLASQPREWMRWAVGVALAGFHGLCLMWVLLRYL